MSRPKDDEDKNTMIAWSIYQASICRRPWMRFNGDIMEVIPCGFCRVCRRRFEEERNNKK